MSKRIQFAINPCSIHGYCLLIDKKTGGDQLSLQMPIEIAEFIVLACNAHEDLLTACKKGWSEMQVWNKFKEEFDKEYDSNIGMYEIYEVTEAIHKDDINLIK